MSNPFQIRSVNDFTRAEEEFQARKQAAALEKQALSLKNQGLERDLNAPKLPFDGTSWDAQIANEAYKFNLGKGMDDATARQKAVDMVMGSKTDYSPVTDPYTGQTSLLSRPRNPIFNTQGQQAAPPGGYTPPFNPDPAQTLGAEPPFEFTPSSDPMHGQQQNLDDPIRDLYLKSEREFNDRKSQSGLSPDPVLALPDPLAQGVDPRAMNSPQVQMSIAEEMGKSNIERAESDHQRQIMRQGQLPYKQVVLDEVDKALTILQQNPDAAGTLNRVGGLVSETPAGQLNSHLQTISSNTGFDRMTEMRMSSPTGSAGLGALTEGERKSLGDSLGALQGTTDAGILGYNLRRYGNHVLDTIYGTPEQIQRNVEQGLVTPEEAAPYMQRYSLTNDAPLTPAERAELDQLERELGGLR